METLMPSRQTRPSDLTIDKAVMLAIPNKSGDCWRIKGEKERKRHELKANINQIILDHDGTI